MEALHSWHDLRICSDEELVKLVASGSENAFEAMYLRYNRQLLTFCRHMLGRTEEAEDAVQHTFLAAYRHIVNSEREIHLRAWLFAVARNRCCSMLRSGREHPTAELYEVATDEVASVAQRRQDIRDLFADLGQLPEEQRTALILSELGAIDHARIAATLGTRQQKVKALVFQARESLVASRAARETDCADIRDQLASLRGGALRRTNLRRHVRTCTGCQEYRRKQSLARAA